MTETMDVRAIAREVAQEVARKLRKTQYLMTRPEVAEALGFQRQSSAIDKIIADPSFPQPIELGEGCRRKWRTKDVEDWIESRRASAADAIFQAARVPH